MAKCVSRRVREQVLAFDPRVGGETVRGFCRRVGISTTTFYRLRKTARKDGPAAALVPASRAPNEPATRYGPGVRDLIVRQRRDLHDQGVEHGPWSVQYRLAQIGITPLPSRSTIARILRQEGLVTPAPAKRPRSSYARWARSAANELWQIDGFEHRLPDGTLVTIYQIIDDATRLLVALHARPGGECTEGAQAALRAGFAAFGKPREVLSDNGSAFNQHRRGRISTTEAWLAEQGIRPLSGRVGHPQTQGKVERSHQGAQRWLDKHQATTLASLQTECDTYQRFYNHERQHQGLGLRITPAMAYESAPKAGPEPHPIPLDVLYQQGRITPPPPAPGTIAHRTVMSYGVIPYNGYRLLVGTEYTGQQMHLLVEDTYLDIFTTNGTHFATIPWPPDMPRRAYIHAHKPPYRVTPTHPD